MKPSHVGGEKAYRRMACCNRAALSRREFFAFACNCLSGLSCAVTCANGNHAAGARDNHSSSINYILIGTFPTFPRKSTIEVITTR